MRSVGDNIESIAIVIVFGVLIGLCLKSFYDFGITNITFWIHLIATLLMGILCQLREISMQLKYKDKNK